MVSSLPPPFQRAKEALRLARVDQSRDFQAQDLAMEAMEVTDIVEKLQLAQDALEFYPFCADAWGVVGSHYLNEEKNLEASIEAYETGVEAARRVYPKLSPERTDNISWSNYDYRPYVRVIIGLAQAYFESGHIDATFETAELLTRRGYDFLNYKLSGWYIQTARWEDARRILRRSDHRDCGILYNEVLVKHHFFEAGGRNEKLSKKLYKSLGRALWINIHVPSHLVLDVVEQRTRPEYVSHGGKDEALRYAIDSSKLWQAAFGALPWLMSVKGTKPNEEVLVQWIRKRLVYVEFLNRPGEKITQNRDKMIESARDGFQMRPECHRPHTIGSVICAQKHDFGASSSENWITFSYKEVVSVPYWSILAPIYEAEEQKECTRRENIQNKKREKLEKRKTELSLMQRMDKVWSELNVQHVSIITSFLSLKEKAAVRSLSTTWKEGSTLDKRVEINPEEVGLNVNGALRFVATSFPRLQHFSLNVDQGYFLNDNDELWNAETETMGSFQLNGESLQGVFQQDSIRLLSANITFDQCIEEHTFRILVEEEGLSALNQQMSLQKLSLGSGHFESLRALSSIIRPLLNLQYLRLSRPTFPDLEYRSSNRDDIWQNPSELLSTIGLLPNLRTLSLENHGITDNDLHHLLSLSELRELTLMGQFGDPAIISLTDSSMTFIASSFPNLVSLEVSYNRSITMKGHREVIRSCPLRELQASEAGIEAQNLEEIIRINPSFRFIRYGVGYNPPNESFLEKATVATHGRCVFTGNLDMYEPKFDSNLLATHNASKKKLIEERRRGERL